MQISNLSRMPVKSSFQSTPRFGLDMDAFRRVYNKLGKLFTQHDEFDVFINLLGTRAENLVGQKSLNYQIFELVGHVERYGVTQDLETALDAVTTLNTSLTPQHIAPLAQALQCNLSDTQGFAQGFQKYTGMTMDPYQFGNPQHSHLTDVLKLVLHAKMTGQEQVFSTAVQQLTGSSPQVQTALDTLTKLNKPLR